MPHAWLVRHHIILIQNGFDPLDVILIRLAFQSNIYHLWHEINRRNILQYRELAKTFYRVNVQQGDTTSFWYENWSKLGCLIEIFWARGCIDLGIPRNATLGTVMNHERGRRHRNKLLRQVEEEIPKKRQDQVQGGVDVLLWRGRNDVFKDRFSSKETMDLLRKPYAIWEPQKGIWFTFSTPKYSLISWLAAKNRLSTGQNGMMER